MNTFYSGEIPIFRLLVPLIVGMALGLSRSWMLEITFLYVTSAVIVFLFIALNIAYKKFKLYRKKWLSGLLICLLLMITGIILAENHKEINHAKHFSKYPADHLLISINQEPKLKGDIVRFTATVHYNFNQKIKTQTEGTLLIALKTDTNKPSALYYGDLLLIKSPYTATEPPYNPAEFNYKKYLEHQNIYFQTFINDNQFVRIETHTGNPIIAYALQIRKNMVGKFKKYMHNQDAISVASTLILGYRADLSQEVLQAYSKTGTMHVLSVSGMHVALIYLLIEWLLKFLNRWRNGILFKTILSILLIWFYALLTGFSPAVCRAAVMITLVIMGNASNRHISMLNILAISAFILLLYNPFYLGDVGFQLSYIAVFGLIWLQPIIYGWFQFNNLFLDKLWSACSVSIAAQTITFPISIFYFHQFPIYFLFSNLFIVIPAMVIMYTGLTLLILPEISFISVWIGFILEKTIVFMNDTLNIIENLPFASWNKIWFNTLEYLMVYVIILLIINSITQNKKLIFIRLSILSVLILTISISWKSHIALGTNNLTFLSLRKNSGIAFRNGKTMILLSDLHHRDKTFAFSIQPFLDSSKITQLSFIDFKTDHQQGHFKKKENLIQFNDCTLLIFDKALAKKKLQSKLKVNYIYLTGNPHIELKDLLKNYEFDLLVVDGRNSDYFIRKIKNAADEAGVKHKILKRNYALTLAANTL